jgi:hypothetical protein
MKAKKAKRFSAQNSNYTKVKSDGLDPPLSMLLVIASSVDTKEGRWSNGSRLGK